jgi:predicted CXXCH cytochrome family protein
LKHNCHRFSLLLVAIAALAIAGAGMAATPKPDIPKAVKGKQCVEDTDYMRRNHMELLYHQRDETVHLGIRTKKHSLKNCFTCHVVKGADNKPITAADPRHFCRECHSYAAVEIDCFQCHASTPSYDANAPYRSAFSTGMKGGHL